MSSLDVLVEKFTNECGNANILFAIMIANTLQNIVIFGGTLRDFFRNVKSNDLDIIVPKNPLFAMTYDLKTRTFKDGFYEQLQCIFGSNVKKVDQTSSLIDSAQAFGRINIAIKNCPDVGSKSKQNVSTSKKFARKSLVIKNMDPYQEDTHNKISDTVELIDSEVLDHDFDSKKMSLSFFNDHTEYILTLHGIEFKLDVSFRDNIDDMSGFKPACAEDSLFIRFGNESKSVCSSEINFSANPTELFDQVSEFVCKHVQSSVLPGMKNQILQNCKSSTTTIFNVDTPKRALKIARFLDEGSNLRSAISKRTIVDNLCNARSKTICPEERQKILSLISYIESNSLSDPNSYKDALVKTVILCEK